MCGDVVCDVVGGGVRDGEGSGKVEWLILRCWGVLITDRRTDGRTDERTDIGGCRVAFATEKDRFLHKYNTSKTNELTRVPV